VAENSSAANSLFTFTIHLHLSFGAEGEICFFLVLANSRFRVALLLGMTIPLFGSPNGQLVPSPGTIVAFT
jgi:hypothetical protein